MNKQVAYYPTPKVRDWLTTRDGVSPSINYAVEWFIDFEQSESTILDIAAEIAASLAAIRVLLEEVRRGKV